MPLTCTRCQGSGFLNIEQVDDSVDLDDLEAVLAWIEANDDHDVCVCDCCGNSVDAWHGTPGEHYGPDDPPGRGPYEYNGGYCECH